MVVTLWWVEEVSGEHGGSTGVQRAADRAPGGGCEVRAWRARRKEEGSPCQGTGERRGMAFSSLLFNEVKYTQYKIRHFKAILN